MGNPLDVQVGGDHYTKYKYQPIEFINDLDLGFIQGNIIKYVIRHKDKNGIQDLKKAIHYCELAIKLGCISKAFHNSCVNMFITQFDDNFVKECIFNVLVEEWELVVKMCNDKVNSIDAPIRQ